MKGDRKLESLENQEATARRPVLGRVTNKGDRKGPTAPLR